MDRQSQPIWYLSSQAIFWQYFFRILISLLKYIKKHTSKVFPMSGWVWPNFWPKYSPNSGSWVTKCTSKWLMMKLNCCKWFVWQQQCPWPPISNNCSGKLFHWDPRVSRVGPDYQSISILSHSFWIYLAKMAWWNLPILQDHSPLIKRSQLPYFSWFLKQFSWVQLTFEGLKTLFGSLWGNGLIKFDEIGIIGFIS